MAHRYRYQIQFQLIEHQSVSQLIQDRDGLNASHEMPAGKLVALSRAHEQLQTSSLLALKSSRYQQPENLLYKDEHVELVQ